MLPLPTTRRGTLRLERALFRTEEGAVALRQRMTGSAQRVVVTHEAALIARVRVVQGALSFSSPAGEVRAPARFVLIVPRRSVLRVHYDDVVAETDGLAHVAPLAGTPSLRAATSDALTAGAMLAEELISDLDLDRHASPAMARARALLHERLGDVAPVRGVAAALGVSADVLARTFARTYGLTPKAYCTRARLFDAAIRLFRGSSIARAAFESEFGDLSRFYAQFRRLLGTTPGVYAAVGKRQDPSSSAR